MLRDPRVDYARRAPSNEEGYVIGQQSKKAIACDNLNHRRANAPVAHCPQCGGIVNQSLRAPRAATIRTHSAARRTFAALLHHLRTQLIAPLR
jgi:hypothetical protein